MTDSSLIYENPLSSKEDIRDFILEGHASFDFSNGCLRMENQLSPDENQKANYVLWCPKTFPSDLQIDWEFKPIRQPGLAILFFAAKGIEGEDLFAPSLQARTGEYPQYHHGDIHAFHVSYFRRKEPDERIFHTCNLRKSYGFHLVAQGADPIPDVPDAKQFYQMSIRKQQTHITFSINGLTIFTYDDDGTTYGAPLKEGKIGFRQLAPMIGEYRNLQVSSISSE